jgi:hypothetical protein
LVELQELIARGRLIFSNAPKRLEVFKLVNGSRSTKEIARKAGRSLSSTLHDIEKIRAVELIKERDGQAIAVDGSTVYEKAPLIKHIPVSFFEEVAQTEKLVSREQKKVVSVKKYGGVHIPSEGETLDICKHGEDQIYEFKAPGVETDKLTKEVAGFLHTKSGGVIFYGIDDDGTVVGSNIRRQDFDQKIQNSVRNTISPPPSIEILERNIMGSAVLLIVVSPWDRKTIYQNTKDGRYYVRKGTNIFVVRPDELKKLSKGEFIA